MVFRDARGTRRAIFERSKPHEKFCLYLTKKYPIIDPFMVMAHFSEDFIKKLPNLSHFKKEDIQILQKLLQEELAKNTCKVNQTGASHSNQQAFDEAAEASLDGSEEVENNQEEEDVTGAGIKTITVADLIGTGDTTDLDSDSSDCEDEGFSTSDDEGSDSSRASDCG